MPFDGNGVFIRVAGNPVVTGTTISSTVQNNTTADFATGLTTCITRNGQSPATANIPMGGFKITGLDDGLAVTDAATVGQLTTGEFQYMTSVSGTNTIVGSVGAALSAYVNGNSFLFMPANDNTGATTVNVNALGAKNLFYNGAACTGKEVQAGVPVYILYDGTQFNIVANGDGYARYDDDNFYVVNTSDKTKRFRFNAGLIPTATDTLLAAPSVSGIIAVTNLSNGATLLPLDYISGFALTTATTTTYNIAAGQAADSTNVANITGGALNGKSQSSWAAGGSAGGKLSVASMANNTWYYWFALLKDADLTVDYGFDVSTTPTLPTGYTKYRYIGARKTALAATTWDTFIQHGDFVQWFTPPAADVSGAISTGSRTLTTMNVPAVKVEWLGEILVASPGNTGEAIIATDPLCADVAPSATASPLGSVTFSISAAGIARISAQTRCWTNTSSQIGLRALTSANAIVQTFGWTDPRGKPV